MFNSSILDVAIGVAFVFLLVSTVCTAVREGIEHLLKTRASYLEYAIRELLRDRKGDGLAKAFFEHPLIQGLYQGDYEPLGPGRPRLLRRGKNMPSYIPSKSFALALIDLAARGPSTDKVSADPDAAELGFDSLRASVLNLQNDHVQRALLAALDASRRDLERARANLEAWYDSVMDRASGWYKRTTQGVIFAIASLIAVGLNVNTITIAEHLYRDQPLRASVVAAAERADKPLSYQEASSNLDQLQLPLGWERGWGAPRSALERRALKVTQWQRANPTASAEQSEAVFNEPLPLLLWNDVFAPVIGLLITAFAATLGAPFWFDILNKVMVIRATVKPHEKSQEEGSEDRQPRARRDDPVAAQRELPTPPAAQNELVVQRPANDVAVHDGADGCGDPILDATPDAELPAARGGVG